MFEFHNHQFDYDIRCLVYEPAGPSIGWLPDPLSIQVAFTADADPALIVEVAKGSPGAEMLIDPVELAVEVWNERANKWVEPPGGRFLALNWTEDFSDAVGVMRFTCPGIDYLMEKIKVRPGPEDAALVAKADAAEDWYKAEKALLTQRENEFRNAFAPLRNYYNLTGSIFTLNYFPKEARGHKLPTKSVLFHVGQNRPYHYVKSAKKWYRFSGTGRGGEIARESWDDIISAGKNLYNQRNKMPRVLAHRDRAMFASRNATRSHKRPLLNSEPTALLARIWQDTVALGGGRLKGIKRSWSWGHDSEGKRFPRRRDREVNIGQSLKSVVSDMVEAGEISWQCRGRYFDVLPAGGFAVDHRDRFSLRLGRDITEAPDRGTRSEFASSFIVSGDENYTSTFSVTDPGPWGAWEESFSIAGVKTYTQALKETEGFKARLSKQIRLESTRGIVIHARSPRPMIDYLPHHWIMVEGSDGLIKQQIRQVTLTRDADGRVGGNLVLGDRFTNKSIDWTKSVSKLADGQDRTVGHTNAVQAPLVPATNLGPDTLNARGELVLGAEGAPRVDVHLSWAGVVGEGPPAGIEGVDSSEEEHATD